MGTLQGLQKWLENLYFNIQNSDCSPKYLALDIMQIEHNSTQLREQSKPTPEVALKFP